MNVSSEKARGFTLIELLVVIAIVAILSVVVILTLNPAELLKQSRDSNRVSDMATVKSAISLYLADVSTSISIGNATTATCYVHASSTVTSSGCGGRYTTNLATGTANYSVAVNGTGWVPINLTAISSGAPVSTFPKDPVNNATYFYSYAAQTSTLTFEMNSKMESQKYAQNGGSDVESSDGGNNAALYEVGTVPGLSL